MTSSSVPERQRMGADRAPTSAEPECHGAGDDWDLFCEHCGYSASEIESEDEADRVARKHLLEAHGIDATRT